MVDVTKSNFDIISKRIESLLPSSCFVSIDLEFTGLRDNSILNENRIFVNKNDLPSQRYMKYRELIQSFCMIQFGVCLWKYDESSSKITSYPFNFWTFPQHTNNTFLSQPSALTFLRENGFDFNKLIDEGIDFLSIDQEKKERKYHKENEQKKQQRINERKQNKKPIQPRTDKDIQYIQEIEQKIKMFVNNTQQNDDEILELGLVGRFRRLLIYQLIETKYVESLIAFKQINDENNNKYLKKIAIKKITKIHSKQNIENEQKKQMEKEWNNNVLKAIGVRKIFDMICLYKVPILLHNGFLDSLHLFRSFIGALPLDPCKFTKRLNEYVPFIYDTKYMMQLLFQRKKMIEHCSLCQCFRFFMGNHNELGIEVDDDEKNGYNDIEKILDIDVCIEMNENKERNKEKEKIYLYSKNGTFHEAGYDAFCTGYVFAKIGAYLYLLNKKNDNKNLYDVKDELYSNDYDKMVTLSHYVNRLNLAKNFNKHFYVGNKYQIDDKFNFNLKYNGMNGDENDRKNDDIYDGVLCGVDYNAINDQWYKMFHCKINDKKTIKNTESMFDRLIIEFLKQYISDSNRIMIYKQRGNIEAYIRVNNISQSEYDKISKGFASKQPNKLTFSKYIDYKSQELRGCYKQIMEKK